MASARAEALPRDRRAPRRLGARGARPLRRHPRCRHALVAAAATRRRTSSPAIRSPTVARPRRATRRRARCSSRPADARKLPLRALPDGPCSSAPPRGISPTKVGMQHAGARAVLRSGRDRRRTGRAGGRGVRRLGGTKDRLIEREAPGGQAGTSSRIENYLGFPSGLTGADLAERATAQARRFGAELLAAQEVAALRVEDPYRIVVLARRQRAPVLRGGGRAPASRCRKLEAPGASSSRAPASTTAPRSPRRPTTAIAM